MASILWRDVVSVAPELAADAVEEQARSEILRYVNGVLDVGVFGGEASTKLRLARMYLAAHYGTRAVAGGAEVGEIKSESVGGLKREYVTSAGGSDDTGGGLRGTTYGNNYLAIVAGSAARAAVLL